MSGFYKLFRPALFTIDPERAHLLTLRALAKGLVPACAEKAADDRLRVRLWDRSFPNPVGLAAGFDKNAEVIAPMLRLGFGFVEAGTVTPRPQVGNPRPRVFRCPPHEAVINRMGFPNLGLAEFRANLEKFLELKPRPGGIVGLNIGMNKDQADPAKDYCALVRALGPLADYLTVNISSPNTPGLRDLQKKENLAPLLARIIEERGRSCGMNPPPLLLKLAPDLDAAQRAGIAETVIESGIDGLILTNTTLSRPDTLPSAFSLEKGGLSGQPVRNLSTLAIRDFFRLTGGRLPIVGAGGISSGADAYEKIRAGASLVQLYSALIYQGPGIARQICRDLSLFLSRDGFNSIQEAVGTE